MVHRKPLEPEEAVALVREAAWPVGANISSLYGDGKASEKIAAALNEHSKPVRGSKVTHSTPGRCER